MKQFTFSMYEAQIITKIDWNKILKQNIYNCVYSVAMVVDLQFISQSNFEKEYNAEWGVFSTQ